MAWFRYFKLVLCIHLFLVSPISNTNAQIVEEKVLNFHLYWDGWPNDDYKVTFHTNFNDNQLWTPVSARLYYSATQKDIDLIPDLADGLPSISEDGLVYMVKLKGGLKFSNGNPLTAEDIVFSYNFYLTPAISNVEIGVINVESNSSIVALDDYTVQFTFNQNQRYFNDKALTFTILEKETFAPRYNQCIEKPDENICFFWENNGTYLQSAGPYRLESANFSYPFELNYIRNEFYHGNPGYADRIIMKGLRPLDPAIYAINQKEPDVIWNYADLTIGDGYVKQQVDTYYYIQLVLNHYSTIWGTGEDIPDDTSTTGNNLVQANLVRKAMQYAINKSEISVMFDYAYEPVGSFVVPNQIGYDPTIPKNEFSIDQAKQAMEDAGFDYSTIIDANGDGDYGDEGDTTFFDFVLYGGILSMTEYIADQWQKIGINAISVEKSAGDVFEQNINPFWENGMVHPTYSEGGYDGVIGTRGNEIIMEDSLWWIAENCQGIDPTNGCFNWQNFFDAQLHAQIIRYRESLTKNLTESIEILQTIQQLTYDKLPDISLASSEFWRTNESLTNWYIKPEFEGMEVRSSAGYQVYWRDVYNRDWITDKKNEGDDFYVNTIVIAVSAAVMVVGSLSYFIIKKKVMKSSSED